MERGRAFDGVPIAEREDRWTALRLSRRDEVSGLLHESSCRGLHRAPRMLKWDAVLERGHEVGSGRMFSALDSADRESAWVAGSLGPLHDGREELPTLAE